MSALPEKANWISFVLHAVLMITFLVGGCNRREQKPAPVDVAPITVNDLRMNPVIGELGIPLGEVAVIEATVIDGDSMKMKEYQGVLLLKVSSVNGKEINSAPLMEFADMLGMPFEDIDRIWIGKSISLEAYEAGVFSGLPTNHPDHWPLWAAPGFSLRTQLNILSWPEE